MYTNGVCTTAGYLQDMAEQRDPPEDGSIAAIGEAARLYVEGLREGRQLGEGMPNVRGTTEVIDEEEWNRRRRRIATRTACINAQVPDRVMHLFEAGLWEATHDYNRMVAKLRAGAILLVVCGEPGCGKSVACCREIARRGRGVFADSSLLSDELMVSEWRHHRAQYSVPLVLDDVGRESNFKRVRTLIRKRYDGDLLTLITTNMTPKKFREQYGRHIDDRIKESGGYITFKERLRGTRQG